MLFSKYWPCKSNNKHHSNYSVILTTVKLNSNKNMIKCHNNLFLLTQNQRTTKLLLFLKFPKILINIFHKNLHTYPNKQMRSNINLEWYTCIQVLRTWLLIKPCKGWLLLPWAKKMSTIPSQENNFEAN